jgi:hypothetical protein
VASFLSVLVSHMSRILDRSRAISDISDDDPKMRALKVSTPGTAVACGPSHPDDLLGGRMRNHDLRPHDRCLCLSLCRSRHEPAAAVLFTLSLCLFTASMISFVREVRISLNQDELAADKSQH